MKPWYCVTMISRLSGEREQVTPPCTKEIADDICEKQKHIPARKRSYLRPKVEVYPLKLDFK